MRVFVTGTAGFIGYHLASRLIADGHQVFGYDGLTPYYDPALKVARHTRLKALPGFAATEALLEDADRLNAAMAAAAPDIVIHLAAQPGVRYGLENPGSYAASNLTGMFNLLEAVRQAAPRHFLFASTSSVYGANPKSPFVETDRTDFPLSLYAATKKAGEAMSHAYAHLHALPTTCFRFFTVYGPWGRPDMALFKFVSAILAGRPIEVYGHGQMARDFTYVDDLVEAIVRLMACAPAAGQPAAPSDSLSPTAPWRSVNIAGGNPVPLPDFIAEIEKALGKTAIRMMKPVQNGDMVATDADPGLLEALTAYRPHTPISVGIPAFIDWYVRNHAEKD